MESRDELEAAQEAAAKRELEQLSLLPAEELIQRIERGKPGKYFQAYAALAATRDIHLAAPFLLRQLQKAQSYEVRSSCASALLALLPYAGIPWYALVNTRQPGHGIYMEDLAAHVEKTLRRLDEEAARMDTLKMETKATAP